MVISGANCAVLSNSLCHIFKNVAFGNVYGRLFTVFSKFSGLKSEGLISFINRQVYYTKKIELISKGNMKKRSDNFLIYGFLKVNILIFYKVLVKTLPVE